MTNARSRLRHHVAQWSRSFRCVHTPWCFLVSADVPRWRLCGSLSVDEHSGACRPRLGCLPVRLCVVCGARVWCACVCGVCVCGGGVCVVCGVVCGVVWVCGRRGGSGGLPWAAAGLRHPPARQCVARGVRVVCACVVCACLGCLPASGTRRPSRIGTDMPPSKLRVGAFRDKGARPMHASRTFLGDDEDFSNSVGGVS